MAFLFEVSGIRLEVREDNDMFTMMGAPDFLPSAMVDRPEKHGCSVDGAVFITKAFMRLPEYFRRIALTHEAGHVACGHLNYAPEHTNEIIVDTRIEAEADRWAANIVGESAYDLMFDALSYETLKVIGEQGGNVVAAKPVLEEQIAERKAAYKAI